MSVQANTYTQSPVKAGFGFTQISGKFGSISNQTTGYVATRNGVPDRCFMIIEDKARGRKFIYSEENGEWSFDFLKLGSYFRVINIDDTGQLNSGIIDWVRPE